MKSPIAPRPIRASVLIFLIAAAVRLTLIFVFHHYEIGSRAEPIRISLSLARSGAFADPYSLPTGPTAHTAPFYPVLMAPLYAIWGDAPAADYVRFTVDTLGACAEYALLPFVAAALGLGWWPGILAGFGGALIPLHLWVECVDDFESTWIALFLEIATILFARWLSSPRFGWRSAALGGAMWGFAFLVSPTVLPVLVGFCVIAWWKPRPRLGTAVQYLAVFAAATLAVIAPWTVRNYVQLGGVFFIRDDAGLELLVSNNDGARTVAADNYRTAFFARNHPFASVAAAREIQRNGELAFERQALSRALLWIRANPGAFIGLTAKRFVLFWVPRVPRFGWMFGAVTLAAFASLLLLYRRIRLPAVILASMFLGYPAIYYCVQTSLRYEHPLWWIQLMLIGWLAATLLSWAGRLRAAH